MAHEKPNGLLETCAMGSPDTCPVKTPHHELPDTVSAIMWNEIKKTVKTAQAAWPGVDFDLTLANKVLDPVKTPHHELPDTVSAIMWNEIKKTVKTAQAAWPGVDFDLTLANKVLDLITSGKVDARDVVSAIMWNEIKKTVKTAQAAWPGVDFDLTLANKVLDLITSGKVDARDVEVSVVVADLERQVVPDGDAKDESVNAYGERCPDLMTNLDRWRAEKSPFRLHDGADLERQVVPDGDAKDESVNAYGERCPDLMTNLDRWRAEKSPFRLHDGASSWRLQPEAERDDEPGVILMEDDGTLDDSIVREINRRPSRGIKDVYCVDVIRFGHQPIPDEPGVILMEDDGTLDDSIVREINRRPSRGIKDVYCVDVIRFGHQPIPLKVVASTPLPTSVHKCFVDDPDIFWSFVANPLGRPFRIKRNGVVEPTVYPAGCVFLYPTTPKGNKDDPDIFWSFVANPLGRPFRIKRNGVVEPTVYPAGCVFLYPTTPKGNKVLIQERPIFVVDASANPKFPLPIGFQKIMDDRLSRRSLFDWDIVKYAIQHDIDYRQAADEHLNIVQQEIAKNKIDTAWSDSHRIEGWTHR